MLEVQDKALLFICSFVLYMLEVDEGDYSIIPIIIGVFFTSLNTYFDNRKLKLAFFLIYIGMCQLIPNCYIFLPLIMYDIALYDYQILASLAIIPLFLNFHEYNMAIIIFTFSFFILAWTLKQKTLSTVRLQQEYNELRDTTKEIAILQEQKNKTLLENQDYEINLATLNERNRISKEIHDNIGHLLSRSLLQIGALLKISKDETITKGLTLLKNSISEGMDSIRNSIHNIHDQSIDLYTLIESLTKEFTFCAIDFEYDLKSSPPIKLKYAFIAIIKEALANIIKHSNATKVRIVLREHPAMYQLIISDNGTMEPDKKEVLNKIIQNQLFSDSMGLQNIIDRIKGFHGNINFNLNNGFQIFITVPKEYNVDNKE